MKSVEKKTNVFLTNDGAQTQIIETKDASVPDAKFYGFYSGHCMPEFLFRVVRREVNRRKGFYGCV